MYPMSWEDRLPRRLACARNVGDRRRCEGDNSTQPLTTMRSASNNTFLHYFRLSFGEVDNQPTLSTYISALTFGASTAQIWECQVPHGWKWRSETDYAFAMYVSARIVAKNEACVRRLHQPWPFMHRLLPRDWSGTWNLRQWEAFTRGTNRTCEV